uniref:Uncharacterized protein n=1 Tax=Oncorhynchus mykiss TaxID=8022 RepID=A0A8C7UY58_ONCMY
MAGVDSFELMYREMSQSSSKGGVSFMVRYSVSNTAKAISETPGVDTMVLVANFSQSDTGCKPVKDTLRGQKYRPPTHIAATTLMTRLVLLGMVGRRRGAVVNISSGACYRPSPSKAPLSCSTGAPHGASAGGSLVPQSVVYACHAISTLGISHRTTGYCPRKLQVHRSLCACE